MTKIIALPTRPTSAAEQQGRSLIQEQRRFLDYLPEKIAALCMAWAKLKYINWDAQILQNLGKASGILQESSRGLLLTRVADRSADLHQLLKLAIEHGAANAHQRQDIDNALTQLEDAVAMARRYNGSPGESTAYNSSLNASTNSSTGASATAQVSEPADLMLSIHVAVVDADAHHVATIRNQLEHFGYQVTSFEHPRQLEEELDTSFFNLVLVDTGFQEGPLSGLAWLESHHSALKETPIIVMSARTDIVARLRAVRAGAQAYVAKGGEAHALHQKIQQTLHYLHHPKDRVLLVHSDNGRLTMMSESLLNAGFHVDTLNLPLLLLERLMRLRPDVVVMNYELPGCNGLELGNLLRQDPTLMSVPIVYMTEPSQSTATRDALALLGNACIELPPQPEALAQTLRHEIQRARMMASPQSTATEIQSEPRLQARAAFFEELEAALVGSHKHDQRHPTQILVHLCVDQYARLKKTMRLRTLVEQEEALERFLASRPEIESSGCSLGEMHYLLILRDIEGVGTEKLIQTLHAQTTRFLEQPTLEEPVLTLTAGVASLHTLTNLDEALEQTEASCARALRDGGNQIAWTTVIPLRKAQLTTPMRAALRNRSFKLVYQPIVNLDKEDVWFEALIRLVDAQGQVYLPQQFLECVDSDMEGGTFALDRLIIDQGLQALTQLGGKGGAGYSLIVKLTPDLLHCERLLPYISNVVNGARLRGVRRMTLSLPEHCVTRDIGRARRLIRHIHGLNCGFMLEQVSITQQSLAQLRELGPIDFIKLHPQWRQQMENERQFRDHVHNVLQLMPDVRLVASHVEDAKCFANLWEAGVRFFQGYFIQEPGEKLTAAPFEAAV